MSSSISILLVDDEQKLVDKLARLLRKDSYNVDTALDVDQAIEKLDSLKYSIVITDLNMPKKNGFELMTYINDNNIDVLPLVLTGYASVEGAIRAIKLGAYDFLEKPVDTRTFALTVKRAAERIILKRENQNHIQQLQKLNHLKNEFLSVVSHDIRSPLSSIGGYANYLLKKGDLSDFQHRYLLIIKEISENLYSQVNELLDISKIEKGIIDLTYEETNLEELVNTSMNNFILLSVDKHNRIEFFNHMKSSTVILDRMKMLQVLNNLIGNAIKFTEEGTITLSAREHEDDMISVSVLDTGVGMSQDEIHYLFDQYNYRHKSGTRGEKGNGLGIVICKRFVELHGGQITVNSKQGEGTEFTVYLPRYGKEQ
jgi:signal transduction histidine kinase